MKVTAMPTARMAIAVDGEVFDVWPLQTGRVGDYRTDYVIVHPEGVELRTGLPGNRKLDFAPGIALRVIAEVRVVKGARLIRNTDIKTVRDEPEKWKKPIMRGHENGANDR